MNLYNVVNRSTGKVVPTVNFLDTKVLAKSLRNMLNTESGYAPNPKTPEGQAIIASGHAMPFTVTTGPAHWRNL